MFNFNKNKEILDKLDKLNKIVSNLQLELNDKDKKINNIIRAVTGVYTIDSINERRIELLQEAKERGFFKTDTIFYFDGHGSFKHDKSDFPENYRYYEKTDSLGIPAIGVDNFTAGCVNIYTNGEWAIIKKM